MSIDEQFVTTGLTAVRQRVAEAEARFGRAAGSVQLLAVSKVQPARKIAAAYAAGQLAFGESYAQEALEKQSELNDLPLHWHFIGRVQSNKTRDIAASFDWVHSVYDLKHARRLGSQRPPELGPLKLCVQVNVSGEASKGGLEPAQVEAFIAACCDIDGVSIEGLMTLPAPSVGLDSQRRPFAALRALRERLATPSLPLSTLSMGMSADLEAAIAEGATIVRVGTAIFGSRPSP
ncbi:MAG: YggS family pyridoxal phosphate-dependent enzyme [Thiohalocapsa sp.]